MRNEVTALREAGKPAVVSMRNLAASGGYLMTDQSSQAICLSVPSTKQSLPLSLAFQ